MAPRARCVVHAHPPGHAHRAAHAPVQAARVQHRFAFAQMHAPALAVHACACATQTASLRQAGPVAVPVRLVA